LVTLEDCKLIQSDRIVKWQSDDDISVHVGYAVRLWVEIFDTDLFWNFFIE